MMTFAISFVRSAVYWLCQRPVISGMLRFLSQSGLLPRRIWKRLPVESTFAVQTTGGTPFLYESVRYDAIGRSLYWRGLAGMEPETTHLFSQLAQRVNTFWDVGANTGVYTLAGCAMNPNLNVVAFEPLPQARERLTRNIGLNHWTERCSVRAEAVSDSEGQAQFHVPDARFPTSASLHPDGFKGYEGRTIECTVIKLDSLLEHHKRIDLIKIDVEGFEDAVLKGMPDILSQCRPILIVECLLDGPHAVIEAILEPLNYRFFHIRPEGPLPMKHIEPDETEQCKNFLFVPEGHPWLNTQYP